MKGRSKNEGIRLIADFKDQAVPLSKTQTSKDKQPPATRSVNTGIQVVADFREPMQSLTGPKTTANDSALESEENDIDELEAESL